MPRHNVGRCSIAIVGLVVASAAFGAEPNAAAPAPSVKPDVAVTTSGPEDLICRDRLRPGSHIKTRACLTAAQWAAPRTQSYVHEGMGPWGQAIGAVYTPPAQGMRAFTDR